MPFSGFVFKIQANMDPAHRDRIAFLRVCSGRFERGMKKIQASAPEPRHQAVQSVVTFMAASREQVEEAYAGDIIGLPNHGNMQIGDSFSEGELLQFTGIPVFRAPTFSARCAYAIRSRSSNCTRVCSSWAKRARCRSSESR